MAEYHRNRWPTIRRNIHAKLSRTAQAVNHWFLEDEIAVSMLFKFANAMGATLELVPEVRDTRQP